MINPNFIHIGYYSVTSLPNAWNILYHSSDFVFRLEVGQDIDSLTNKVTELTGKFEQAKQEINSESGIDSTKERQELVLKSLKQQLQIKKQVVEKYQNLTLAPNQQPTCWTISEKRTWMFLRNSCINSLMLSPTLKLYASTRVIFLKIVR